MSRVLAVAVAVIPFVASACSAPDSPPPDETELVSFKPEDCASVKVPTYTDVRDGVFTHCVSCHSSTKVGDARNGAPDEVNFDTYDAAKLVAGQAVPLVRRRLMPYPKGEGLTNADRNQLYEWAICGTPP